MTSDRRVPQSHPAPQRAETVRSTNFVFPNDTIHLGTMFGGQVLHLMDQTGAIAAARFAHATVVTAAMEAVSFERPIRLGMIIETAASVVYTGRTSMIVRVEVLAEDQYTGVRFRATTGYLTMVALDDAGHPSPVPPLVVETEEEHAAHTAAVQIRHAALARAEESR